LRTGIPRSKRITAGSMVSDQDQPAPGLADEAPATVEGTTVATTDSRDEESPEIQSRSSNIDFVTLGMFIIGE
jgi:hypothetical protein